MRRGPEPASARLSARTGRRLVDEIDRPHAAVADPADHAPDADALVDREVAAPVRFDAGERPRSSSGASVAGWRSADGAVARRRSSSTSARQVRIVSALRLQERRPPAGRQRQRRVEERVDLGPAPSLVIAGPPALRRPAPSAATRARASSRAARSGRRCRARPRSPPRSARRSTGTRRRARSAG